MVKLGLKSRKLQSELPRQLVSSSPSGPAVLGTHSSWTETNSEKSISTLEAVQGSQ